MAANKEFYMDVNTIDNIRSALMKDPIKRSKQDLESLKKYLFSGNLLEKLNLKEEDLVDDINPGHSSNKEGSKASICKKLLKSMQYRYFQENVNAFNYGDVGDLFYIIFTGSVAVQIPIDMEEEEKSTRSIDSNVITLSENGKKVRKLLKTVGVLPSGWWFGELALINSKPRGATIKCLETPTEFITISKQDYNQIIGGKVKLGEFTIYQLLLFH
jgi:hypothetical protein